MMQMELPIASLEVMEISVLALALEPQAQLVLLRIAKRLLAGQAEYGKMDLANDQRNFLDEAAEEALDIVVYREMALLRNELLRK